MDTATVRYDKDGDDHYDVISAFIKSMRGSDPDAAIHYLARMLKAGEDPRFIARRIMIAASEEVGMAAPQICRSPWLRRRPWRWSACPRHVLFGRSYDCRGHRAQIKCQL